MNAVVALTRGYNELSKYDHIIKRNKCLEKYFNKNISYIICHEGNISQEHQQYIQTKTLIPLIFIDVLQSFLNENIDFYPPTKKFKMGYRNMCNFWFCDFWKYLEHYDKIIRIDEDCFYNSDYSQLFSILDEKVAVYGEWTKDDAVYTKGIQNFTKKFMMQHNIKPKNHGVGGPYTNVIGLNLKNMRENKLLIEYIEAVKKTNNIYIYRWGDLPLWGEALNYCFLNTEHRMLKNIKYYHGSHKKKVN